MGIWKSIACLLKSLKHRSINAILCSLANASSAPQPRASGHVTHRESWVEKYKPATTTEQHALQPPHRHQVLIPTSQSTVYLYIRNKMTERNQKWYLFFDSFKIFNQILMNILDRDKETCVLNFRLNSQTTWIIV